MNTAYELGRTLHKSAMGGGMHYGNPKPKPKPKPKNKRDHKPGDKTDYKDMPYKKADLHPMVQQLHTALIKASAAKAGQKQAARQLKVAQVEMAGTSNRAADFLEAHGLNDLSLAPFTQAMEKGAAFTWKDFLAGAGAGAAAGGGAGSLFGGVGAVPGALIGGGLGGLGSMIWGGRPQADEGGEGPAGEAGPAGTAAGGMWGRDMLRPQALFRSDPMMQQMMMSGLRRQAMMNRYRMMQQYLGVGQYGLGSGSYGPSFRMR